MRLLARGSEGLNVIEPLVGSFEDAGVITDTSTQVFGPERGGLRSVRMVLGVGGRQEVINQYH